MLNHISNRIYFVEILPPKHSSDDMEADLMRFADKYNRVMESGYCACITDNAMGNLAFQGLETIVELGLKVNPEQLMIHLNTFHSKEDLDSLLDSAKQRGIKYFLVVTGDGSARLPKLRPSDIEAENVVTVTSVELLHYVKKHYPEFVLGVAFNQYEPEAYEFEKLERKLKVGASFVITQPLINCDPVVDKLLKNHPNIPVIIEAWMSKNLHLLSDVVGYVIPESSEYDPIVTLETLRSIYHTCGFYLSMLGFKTQYHILENM